ncbi:MAG: PINc/VapC family ATPase [Asgard group archaeon]|nr:PINc/VapC family ATPase [Asgard group archaeon]
MKIVPDTSVIISHQIVSEVLKLKSKITEIIIPQIVISEIENMANNHKAKGFQGLDGLKDLRFECNRLDIPITLAGERPTLDEIRLASSGELDALIRDVARLNDAVLYTSDKILLSMCEIEGIKSEYLKQHPPKKPPIKKIHEYFDEHTMSVHLREKMVPLAKKGQPGNWKLKNIGNKVLTNEDLDNTISDILTTARTSPDCFIEMDEPGAKVIQLGAMRVVIATPPFSDALEITAVQPITQLELQDYDISDKLFKRLKDRAEGILIAGSPGAGKSTFAQALANFYASLERTIKTIEKPRDLQVGPEVSQYTGLSGDFRKTADIMLLIRPDFVIFDELRKTDDFKAFGDMRLAGIGLVGVIHSTKAIEAIQRFIGRIDLGMIPSILDTVIFIEGGDITDVLELRMTVKTPIGMTERDLARPVIEVLDFESNTLRYDIFVFGEQVSVIPIESAKKKMKNLLPERKKSEIKKTIRQFTSVKNMKIVPIRKNRIRVEVPSHLIPKVIGRKGKTIAELENRIGFQIDVQPLDPRDMLEEKQTSQQEGQYKVPIDIRFTKSHLILSIPKIEKGANIEAFSSKGVLFSGSIGKRGNIKIDRATSIAKKIIKEINRGETIYARKI